MKRIAITTFVSILILSQLSCSKSPKDLVAEHTRKGDQYLIQEKYQEALIEFKNAVQAAPEDVQLRWKLAKSAIGAKDFSLAFRELQKVVEIDPSHYDAKEKLGEFYLVGRQVEEAEKIAEEIVQSKPEDPRGYVLQARLAVQKGDLDGSIGLMKKAEQLDPGNVDYVQAVGNLYFLKRDKDNAGKWYDRALEIAPESVDVHVKRGTLFFATGKREEGEQEFRKAVDLSVNKEDILLALAQVFLYQGMVEDAEKELSVLIESFRSQKARGVLAELKIEQGKIAEAQGIVRKILEENPKDLIGKYLEARIALTERRLNDAKSLFAEVIEKDAHLAAARLYNGVTELKMGNIEVGKKEIQEAVRLNPGYSKAHLVLGELYLRTNSPELAEKEALGVLQRNPADFNAFVIYGDSFLLRKDWEKAEQVYRAMVKQVPKNPLGYYKMGISSRAQRKFDRAVGYFSQALERSPKELRIVNDYIFALLFAEKHERAKSVMNDCRERDPENPFIWEMQGRFSFALRDFEEGEKAFLKAIELAPEYSQPFYELGMLYSTQGRLPEAEQRFKSFLEKNPENAGAETLLGTVLNLQGKFDEANEHYRKALEISNKNAVAANNLASNLSDHGGNLDEALKFAQIAREASPESPSIADTLGWIYYKKGLVDMALPLIAEASSELQKNPVVRFHHGTVLAEKGRNEEAKTELAAALKIKSDFPGADEAKKLLERIQ